MINSVKISLIVAHDRDRLIGDGAALPWHIPADLKRFRAITTEVLGAPLIMGRKTYEYIGKPLDKRTNIVMTRNRQLIPVYEIDEERRCELMYADTVKYAALLASGYSTEAFVIGGAEVYDLFLPYADRIYLTQVHAHVAEDHILEAPIYCPDYDRYNWDDVYSEDHFVADVRDDYLYSYRILDRLPKDANDRYRNPGS